MQLCFLNLVAFVFTPGRVLTFIMYLIFYARKNNKRLRSLKRYINDLFERENGYLNRRYSKSLHKNETVF